MGERWTRVKKWLVRWMKRQIPKLDPPTMTYRGPKDKPIQVLKCPKCKLLVDSWRTFGDGSILCVQCAVKVGK